MMRSLEIPIIEQALIDVSVSWHARCLYAYMLSRRYAQPVISGIAEDTGLSGKKVGLLISELTVKGWIIRRPGRIGRPLYDLVYKGIQ